MSTYFYLASELDSGLVMDVEGGSSVDGAAVISNKKSSPAANSQLWAMKPAGEGEANFNLVSQLPGPYNYITLKGKNAVLSDSGTVFSQQNIGGGMFYLIAEKSNDLLTVQGSSIVPGTRIVSAPQNPDTDSQKWEKQANK